MMLMWECHLEELPFGGQKRRKSSLWKYCSVGVAALVEKDLLSSSGLSLPAISDFCGGGERMKARVEFIF